ncbi:hypothetical protein CC1G_00540 [Coprinopsis cinerea okayama7|uniref:F-box domain-containing protein n=1 Tax=Coprinopsis cinerea (strain Okayama-7 / 130 / ATCC MYA-4618 / FGSC 9003) TaxID=240176 RepID=A8N3B6_COPC7|nr:hypothetical protein CC1G_00540 [Coprinopsis cinerea okayama7\|eukprot:XP_001829361.2 hypothetical protein CC1G_00540 [Coprinopsis cinerea okayama7\
MLDDLFPYLYIEDILSLRRVNKAFYLLTHEPIIWKRFLLRMKIPIPPLRPTFRYSLTVTDYEIEQLVTQAITVDDNWRRPNPTIFSRNHFWSHHKTTNMFLLPGGKYLIASAQSRDKLQFWLVLYQVDHPMGPRALARIPTYSEAYNVEAKFMRLFEGEEGLVIAYTRRLYVKQQPDGMVPSDLSTKHHIDIDGGFKYEVVTAYTSLDILEYLCSPELEQGTKDYLQSLASIPAPFKELAIVSSRNEVTQISLIESEGAKLVSFIVSPTELHFMNLQNFDQKSTMIFRDHPQHAGKPHRIRAFRVYPGQSNMVVIRSVSSAPGTESHLVEWHDLPKFLGHIRSGPRARYTLHNKQVARFVISDYGLPNKERWHEDQPMLRHTCGPPPPVSIFLELRNPDGVEHHAVYPRQVVVPATKDTPEHFTYTYDHDTYQMSTHICAPHRASVLAGSQRALICITNTSDRTLSPKLLKLRRYCHPRNSGVKYKPDPASTNVDSSKTNNVEKNEEEEMGPVLRKGERLPVPRSGIYKTIDTGGILDEINQQGGVRAICWDESTGRICVAPEEGSQILVLEASRMAVRPNKRVEEWNRKREWLGRDALSVEMDTA